MKLGDLVKQKRESLGLTLEELASATGSSKSHVWNTENHRNPNISLASAIRISIALGIPMNILAAASLESEISAAAIAQRAKDQS